MARAPLAPAAFIKPGALVWYEASPGHRFGAVVDSDPWLMGDHTWVARLRDLGDDYRDYTKRDRTTVPAAACSCLTERHETSEPPAPLRADLFVIVTFDGEVLHSTVSKLPLISWALANAKNSIEIERAQARGWRCVPCALVEWAKP